MRTGMRAGSPPPPSFGGIWYGSGSRMPLPMALPFMSSAVPLPPSSFGIWYGSGSRMPLPLVPWVLPFMSSAVLIGSWYGSGSRVPLALAALDRQLERVWVPRVPYVASALPHGDVGLALDVVGRALAHALVQRLALHVVRPCVALALQRSDLELHSARWADERRRSHHGQRRSGVTSSSTPHDGQTNADAAIMDKEGCHYNRPV
eukprot:TRINITY_DN7842_c0_g1_i9.p1 TRINITY_DN7842_c0_g1~~TRINITY_DN7842_c0_g1_i9.p1  ORF type:complete len:205 (-),score=7.26 TRINITY_DN7842_c0_g1_i9:106-720(-)